MSGVVSPRVSRSREMIELQIGGIHLGIEASPPVGARLRLKYGDFVRPPAPGRSAPRLRIDARLADGLVLPTCLRSVRLEDGWVSRGRIRAECYDSLDLQ